MEQIQEIKQDTIEQELADTIIDAIQDIKGDKIIKIDLRNVQDAPASFFIICEAESVTKINAIANNMHKKVFENMHLKPGHMEGGPGARWVLVDYFSTIAHIFYPETRAFYDLEGLWSDGIVTTYENI